MPSTLQKVLVGEELLDSVRLLKVGLRELNKMDASTDFFHLPILLLSTGFERMMKVAICCHHLETDGEFPSRDVFPRGRRGHDLVWLLEYITDKCFTDDYLSKIPAANADISFLRDDARLKSMVQILSSFGQAARYYKLNVVFGDAKPGPSPDDEWQRLEMQVLQQDPEWTKKLSDPTQSSSVHLQVNRELTIYCEKWARSLSRLFTIGGLGAQAKQISPHVHHFLCLMDQQLGRTNYDTISI